MKINIRKSIECIFISLLLLNIVIPSKAVDVAICEVNHEFQNTNLHTSVNEEQSYYLDKYFSGFNLSYEIEIDPSQPTPPAMNKISITPSVYQKSTEVENDDYKIIIGYDMIEQSSGEAYFAVLAANLEGDLVVRYGSGNKTSSPYFGKKVAVKGDNSITCFGITLISPSVAVLDCVKYMGGSVNPPYENWYYITSSDGSHKEEYQQIGSCYLHQDPFGRKTVKYDTSHDGISQIYLISAVLFDQDEGDVRDNYLTIYRYSTIDPEEMHNGHLVQSSPVTANSLGLVQPLQISGFDTLGDFIYVLDHTQGVFFFRYIGNKIVNLVRHLNAPADYAKRYGLSVNYAGSVVQMLIAEGLQLVEYQMYHVDDGPFKVNTYKIENTIIGSVEMQSNADYIALQQGRLLTVYDRGQTNNDYIKAQIENAEQFHLWYSNDLYVFHESKITNYVLVIPSIDIKPHIEQAQLTFKINAISTNFQTTKKCSLTLTSVIISDASSQKAYPTDFPTHIEWSYQQSAYTVIPLEVYYVGPNLSYKVSKKSSGVITEQTFLSKQKQDDGDHHIILYDEPKIGKFSVNDEEEWRWTEIVPAYNTVDNSFYSIHQDSKYNIVVYLCSPSFLTPSSIKCGDRLAVIEFGSAVETMSFGTWGNEQDVLAIVSTDIPGVVKFYTLLPMFQKPAGTFWFAIDFNDVPGWGYGNKVMDVLLHENTLYTVLQGKSSRFVGISSFIVDVQHRSRITKDDIKDWPQLHADNSWNPESIQANKKFPNVIFIKNKLQIFIVSTQNHTPMFLDFITIYTDINTQIFVTPHSLIYAQANDLITDYSLQDLNSVSMDPEFTFKTYNYKFIDPFTITAGPNTGLIYVLAFENGKNDLKLLVYRSGNPNIKTLYKVIDIESNVTLDLNKKVTIDAGGIDVDFVFIQYNGKKKYVRSPLNPSIVLIPIVGNPEKYVDLVSLEFQINPWDTTQTPFKINHDITLVNSQTTLIVDYAKVEMTLPATLYANDKDSVTWSFDVSKWYEGSAINMEIACSPNPEVCGQQIKIRNQVYPNPDYDTTKGDIYVVDIMSIGNKIYTLVMHPENQKRYIIKEQSDDLDNSKTREWNTFDPQSEISDLTLCMYLTPMYDDNGILKDLMVLCQDTTLGTWGVMVVKDKDAKPTDGEFDDENKMIYFEKVTNVERGQYEYFHNEFFVNNQSEDVYSGIYIFDLTSLKTVEILGQKVQSAKKVNVINHNTFSTAGANIYVTSFYVGYENLSLQKEQQKYVRMIVTDSRDGDEYAPFLWVLNLEIDNMYQADFDFTDRVDLRNFIKGQGQFINEQSNVINYSHINTKDYIDQQEDREYVIYSGFLMFDNTAIYEIDLYFKVSISGNSKPMDFQEKMSKIVAIYNNYGVSIPYPQIHTGGGALGIAFFNPYSKDVTVALYNYIPRILGSKEENISDSSAAPLYTLRGGVVLNNEYGATGKEGPPIAFVVYNNPKSGPALLTKDLTEDNGMVAMNFQPDQIQIETNGKFEQQHVKFMLESDYSTGNSYFEAKVDPHKFKPVGPEDKGGVSGWVIALCVVLGIVLLGGVGYWFYRKKMQNQNNPSIHRPLNEDKESDAGMSLQEANAKPSKA